MALKETNLHRSRKLKQPKKLAVHADTTIGLFLVFSIIIVVLLV